MAHISTNNEVPSLPCPETKLPGEVDGVNTDGKPQFEWTSKYPPEARRQQYIECAYLVALLLVCVVVIFCTWNRYTCELFNIEPSQRSVFIRYSYFALGGLLGGTVFASKYLYRVVARGWWTEDRKLWRFLSPLLSSAVAVIVGTFFHAGIITAAKSVSSALALGLGFLVGYFSDHALRKMQEIASVVFGESQSTK